MAGPTTLLLDTHALAWAVGAPDRLGESARSAVTERTTELLVSVASVWEMATKVRTGKWPEAEPLVDRLDHVLTELAATVLPISAAHARHAGLMRWAHRDPFDRMLAAQALIERCPLVTRDEAFGQVAGLAVLW